MSVLLLFAPAIISFLYNGAAFLMKTDYRFLLKDYGISEYSPSLHSSEKKFKGLILFNENFIISEKSFPVSYTKQPSKNSSGGSFTVHIFPIIQKSNDEVVGFINAFPFSSYRELEKNPEKKLAGFLNSCQYNVSEKYRKTSNAKKIAENFFCLEYFPEEEINGKEFGEKAWPILFSISMVHFFICTAILIFFREKKELSV